MQIDLLYAFHTCFDSEVDVQARMMSQEQEECFPGCFVMFVKAVQKWIKWQESSNVLFELRDLMEKFSIKKNKIKSEDMVLGV